MQSSSPGQHEDGSLLVAKPDGTFSFPDVGQTLAAVPCIPGVRYLQQRALQGRPWRTGETVPDPWGSAWKSEMGRGSSAW